MYPTIYHALLDLFGLDWPWAKLLNSFGFFVAIAFVVASYAMSRELKRKEAEGLIKGEKRKLITGKAPEWSDIITNGLIGFIVGWKFVYLFANSSTLFVAGGTPQAHIFSSEGYVLLGLLVGGAFGFWRWWEYKKQQLPTPKETIVDYPVYEYAGTITFIAAICGIIGAKLFHLFENPKEFMAFFTKPDLQSFLSGLTVYGGLIMGAAGVLFFAYKKKINFLHLTDATTPGLMLAYGIGRIGCQVSGDGDWGVANSAPKPGWLSWMPDWAWSYNYPNNVNGILGPSADTFGMRITDPNTPCWDGYCTELVPSVWPTPFYETIMATIIFLILWSLRKRIKVAGVITGLYLIFNGIERFLIESIRVNNKFDLMGIQATQAQVLAVCFIFAGVIMLFWRYKVSKKQIQV
jgi:prolipoprotein diacylglyceryl transferase